MFTRFLKEEEGQNLVEYGLIMSLLALISIVALKTLGRTMQNTFNTSTGSLNTSTNK